MNIRYNYINIKHHSQVTYLGCVLDKTMLGETMALKVINRIGKIDILQKSFAECPVMLLFSHILIMRVWPETLISMKK